MTLRLPAKRRLLALSCLMLVGCLSGNGLLAQEPPTEPDGDEPITAPRDLQINCDGKLIADSEGYACNGPVTITWEDSRIQADSLTITERRYIEAEGNVLIVWGGNRIFGSRLSYDLGTERGRIEDAMGTILDQYLVWARSAEKIGDDKVKIKSAMVTTCTQPTPYWSFRVSRATITIDKYARMTNVRLKAGKVPFFYLPYLIWPVKDGRAAGLLMPEFGNNRERGSIISQELFIPLGRSADLTLVGRYFSRAGLGVGGEFRFIPNENGQGTVRGFYIDDSVYAATQPDGDGRRHSFTYRQDQQFLNGFRMVADVNFISDPNYFSDFARDLSLASAPDVLARLEFSRNGRLTSLNARLLRREQLSTEIVTTALPQIEWRGRSTKLGKTPLYFQFVSSLASLQRRDPLGNDFAADYWRGDVFPTLTMPLSPFPWLDISPRLSYRYTYWTQQRRTRIDSTGSPFTEVLDDSLARGLLAYGVELIGPKFYRIFDSGARRYKHNIEARVTYGFAESYDRADDVIRFDAVDSIGGSDRQVNYSLVQRLFSQRPRSQSSGGGEGIVLPDGTTVQPNAQGNPDEARESQPQEPLEVASLTIGQGRSLDQDLSRGIVDEIGTEETSPYSEVAVIGRYSPSQRASFDLRANWDIIFDRVGDVTLSGNYRNPLTALRVSFVHREGLGFRFDSVDPSTGQAVYVENDNDTQVRLYSGFNLLRDTEGTPKVLFSFETSYIADPSPNLSNFPDQAWKFRYATQCCTFFLERLTREIDDRRELQFRVDLTGVGQLLRKTF